MKSCYKTLVLFDLYGTLADIKIEEKSEDFWRYLYLNTFAGQKAGSAAKLKNLYEDVIKDALKDGVKPGFLMQIVFARLLDNLGISEQEESPVAFARQFRKHSIINLQLKPYTLELLEILNDQHITAGLLSNTEAILTHYDLSALGIEKYFSRIFLSSEINIEKPDKKAFDIAMNELDIHKEQAVYVGDNMNDDVFGALNASMDVVFINNDKLDVSIISGFKNKMVIAEPSLESILQALQSLGVKIIRSDSARCYPSISCSE